MSAVLYHSAIRLCMTGPAGAGHPLSKIHHKDTKITKKIGRSRAAIGGPGGNLRDLCVFVVNFLDSQPVRFCQLPAVTQHARLSPRFSDSLDFVMPRQ
jgi:hypothetical protein